MSESNSISHLVPHVAELVPVASSSCLHGGSSPVLTEPHRHAIRLARQHLQSGHADILPVDSQTIFSLADASHLAYSACDRPVRADLVSSILQILVQLLADDVSSCPIDPLPFLSLHSSSPVDRLESVKVLANDLWTCEGFCSPHLGAGAAMALREALRHRGLSSASRYRIRVSSPSLTCLMLVAVSVMYPRGFAHLAPGCGPLQYQPTVIKAQSGISIQVCSAPTFVSHLCFSRDQVALTMERDVLRTFIALFIADHRSVRRSYPFASLTPPRPGRPGMFKLSGLLVVPITVERFLVLQQLCLSVWRNTHFQAWSAYRALMFGDI